MCQAIAHDLTRRETCCSFLAAFLMATINSPLMAASRSHGCWLRAPQGSSELSPPSSTSGNPKIDAFCRREMGRLNRLFQVDPGFCFFHDPKNLNAQATRDYLFDPTKPDGTVMLGVEFSHKLYNDYRGSDSLPLVAVMAHEWGHILQFKTKFTSEWGVTQELNADRGAGWYLLQTRQERVLASNRKVLSSFYAELGGAFNDFEFHGLPTQRSYALLDGAHLLDYDVGNRRDALSTSVKQALRLN